MTQQQGLAEFRTFSGLVRLSGRNQSFAEYRFLFSPGTE